jgi:hypothetical protein
VIVLSNISAGFVAGDTDTLGSADGFMDIAPGRFSNSRDTLLRLIGTPGLAATQAGVKRILTLETHDGVAEWLTDYE